ncbi:MAG TPA: sigma-70 family RNA polymerase sigma factor [Planctomycetota bacterium]|nr:sigma-70 family RNA polymerase sigma factor [Planctomycetota bacterium]
MRPSAAPETLTLLRRWHSGDAEALSALLERHLPAIRERLRKRMGPLLRARTEAEDVVQDVMLRVLADGPRFEISDDEHFRLLLARIVENALRDAHRGFTAMRRDAGRERELPPSSILPLGVARAETPSEVVGREEREEWVRLALQVVDGDTRQVVVLHQWEGKTFAAIGAEVGIAEDAARMRYNRGLVRLTKTIHALRRGRVEQAVGPDEA